MNPNVPQSQEQIEAENEHFYLSEKLISWMERIKSQGVEHSRESLADILPVPPPSPPSAPPSSSTSSPVKEPLRRQPSTRRLASATGVAWNLAKIFAERQAPDSVKLDIRQQLERHNFDLSTDSDELNHINGLRITDGPLHQHHQHAGGEEGGHCEDRERIFHELTSEFLSVPKNYRASQSTVILEENVERLASDPERSKIVIDSLLKWLQDPANYNQLDGSYYTANHLLKTILDVTSTTDQVDAHNGTLVTVCMSHPESVQIFSPYLSPSTCSPQCFLKLYKEICFKQGTMGPMATFVLLSKFDLNSYLSANAKDTQGHQELIRTTCSALKDISKNHDDSHELTLDLFKRHLQIELTAPLRRQPEEFLLVLSEFLETMSEHVLAPNLWLDYLTIMGLEVNIRTPKSASSRLPQAAANNDQRKDSVQMMEESNITVESLADDVARLAETQMIFDHNSASVFMQTISKYMRQQQEASETTLLELYQDYLEQFGMIMLSATFMWLKSACELHRANSNNYELIWNQFIDLWRPWILPTKNCANVSKSSYTLVISYFVVSLRYMMHKFPKSTCAILQSMLFELTNYVIQTRNAVHLELTILQRCLKKLAWSSLIATPSDIGNLAALSEQNTHNVSDLVGHVIGEMNTKESLTRIQQSTPESLAHVVERLATIIVLQSSHLRGYKLYRRYFSLIPVDDIPRLANLVLARTEFQNPENSHSNKLLVKLLRYICVDPTPATTSSLVANGSDKSQQQQASGESIKPPVISVTEKFERAVIYARFVSNYLVDLIRRHQNQVANYNKKYLNSVINNSLIDLEPTLSSQELDMGQKTILYASLLKCCSCDVLDSNSRLLLARSVVESHLLRNKPKLVVELVQAISQFLRDSRILVLMVETLVDLHRSLSHESERVWANFNLRSIPDELYLNTCVEEKAPLALMVYFESLFSLNQLLGSSQTSDSDAAANSTRQSSYQAQYQKPLTRNQIWAKFFLWLARLTQALCNLKTSDQLDGSKLTTTWLRILALFEPDLAPYLTGDVASSSSSDSNERPGSSCSNNNSGANGSEMAKLLDTSDQERSMSNSSESELAKSAELKSLVVDKSPSKLIDSTSGLKRSGSSRQQPQPQARTAALATLTPDHKCLLSFIKQLISFYDSINTSGLWSYLKGSAKSEGACRVSVTALAIACFLAYRALIHLNQQPSLAQSPLVESGGSEVSSPQTAQLMLLRDELAKLSRACMGKLEAGRKSKSLLESAQFIETLLASVQQHERVQYGEGVQLIKTYARASGAGAAAGAAR